MQTEAFLPLPPRIFHEIQNTFVKHTSTAVRSSEILIYLLGGNPTLAQMLLQWLMYAEEDDATLESHVFESKMIVLKHQGSKKGTVEVDTRPCMEYLTALADPKEMLKDYLLCAEKDLWWKMAVANQVVDLFDMSTWCGTDYEPLVDLIHNIVVPHPVHQQLAESYVQAAALVSSTNVEEDHLSN